MPKQKLQLDSISLLEMFKQRLSMREIADVAGVTHQRIQQIYNTKFRDDVFGGTPYRELVKEWRLEERLADASKASKWTDAAKKIAEAAKEQGLTVEPHVHSIYVNQGRQHIAYTCASHLVINGKICSTHMVNKLSNTSTHPGSHARYFRTSSISEARKAACDFAIFYCQQSGEEPLIFVAPRSALVLNFLYIPHPANQVGYNNRYSTIPWYDYLEHWDLLRQK